MFICKKKTKYVNLVFRPNDDFKVSCKDKDLKKCFMPFYEFVFPSLSHLHVNYSENHKSIKTDILPTNRTFHMIETFVNKASDSVKEIKLSCCVIYRHQAVTGQEVQ